MAALSNCLCLLLPLLFCVVVYAQMQTEPSITSSVHQPRTPVSYRAYGNVLTYPDNPTPTRYFTNKLDFKTINGSILIGAADNLFLLSYNLKEVDSLSWFTPDRAMPCTDNAMEYVCRNHIRVYDEIPSEENVTLLLLCGTQSNEPGCRTVEITDNLRFGNFSTVSASDDVMGLISAHPDLPGFGEFRRSSSGDMSFFGASFETSNTRTYDFAYYNVNVSESAVPISERKYGYLTTTMTWLNFPVVFVDYRREDYSSPSDNNAAFQFYFVFLRENFQMDNREVLYSRVVRICRNDPGTTASSGSQIFSTYLKARIFCFREMPPGTEYVGAQDFEFNEIWSLSFNDDDGGRYYSDGPYHKLMYGAFSGPLIGPPGTAICVYPAYPAEGQDTLNNGIFDIFQGDVAISNPQPGGNSERQNTFVECDPAGRNQGNEAEDIQIIKDISQLGDNPLLILNGVHVSQMVVDSVCVVKRNNPNLCVNQDVLFLGTNTGLVYKVIMATVTPPMSGNLGVLAPVVVDEIQLNDSNSVDEMRLEVVGGDKFLYVSTASRIYRLPLENCAGYGNFGECVGSRDPYCVWNSVTVTCERSSLQATGQQSGNVQSYLSQNIHTGMVDEPEVSFTQSTFTVDENQTELEVTITASRRVDDGVLEMVAMDGTARAGVDYELPSPPSVNFSISSNSTSRTIRILRRSVFTGNIQFTLSLQSSGEGALSFGVGMATVTIVDEQAVLFQLAIGELGTQTCEQWILFDRTNKITAINSAVLEVLNLKPEDNVDALQDSSFSCAGKLSDNNKEFAVFRSVIDLTKLQATFTRSNVIAELTKWVDTFPAINDRGNKYSVLKDINCDIVIVSLNQPLCAYSSLAGTVGGLEPTAAAAGASVSALGAVLGVFLLVCGVLAVVVGVLALFNFRKNRRGCYNSSSVGTDMTDGANGDKQDLGDSNGSEPPQTPTTATVLIDRNSNAFFPEDNAVTISNTNNGQEQWEVTM